jgi:hypothetical protein
MLLSLSICQENGVCSSSSSFQVGDAEPFAGSLIGICLIGLGMVLTVVPAQALAPRNLTLIGQYGVDVLIRMRE